MGTAGFPPLDRVVESHGLRSTLSRSFRFGGNRIVFLGVLGLESELLQLHIFGGVGGYKNSECSLKHVTPRL